MEDVRTPDAIDDIEIKYPGPKDLVHLHSHTIFSALDGIASPEDYMKRCGELGMSAIAITDHGCLASFPDAYFAAKTYKIKFIPGCEIYYNDHHNELQEFQKSGNKWSSLKLLDLEKYELLRRHRHVTVLSKNQVGYKNLIHMTTNAWEIGHYYKPRIWMDILDSHKDGLIILSGCMNGPVCHEIRAAHELTIKGQNSEASRHLEMARQWLNDMREIFGKDLYIEMQMPGKDLDGSIQAFATCARWSDEFGIKAVITNDCHYIHRQDFDVQKCMMAVDQKKTLDDPELFTTNSSEQYFKSRSHLRAIFHEHGYNADVSQAKFEEICDNTVEAAEKCDGFKPDLSPKLPAIKNASDKLTVLVLNALKDKELYNSQKKYEVDGKMVTHKEQALIELSRIISKGFAPYFLVIRDLIQYSINSGWDVGPARGSAGGSLVCFLIGIHELDPLKWHLSFNRFMSPSRGGNMLKVSME
jgi:DNA polymerase-3 subunit alpha